MLLDDHVEPLIPFEDLADLLMPLGCLNGPAELHGLLCGKLCGGLQPDESTWLEQAWEFLDVTASPGMEATEAMIDLLRITIAQFHSENYDVQLLVPGDDVDLDQRVQALSQWCHGFLTGFGTSGIDADAEFSPSSAESVRDLAAIVQASIDDSYDDEEEAEQDYFNVGEYVRMAVLTLYADFGQREFDRVPADTPPAADDDDGPTYH
jgi:uncharacterized protein YgfB (UPF0149 family)